MFGAMTLVVLLGACNDRDAGPQEGPEASSESSLTAASTDHCFAAFQALECPAGSHPDIILENESTTVIDLDDPDVLLPQGEHIRTLRPGLSADAVGYAVQDYGSCTVYCRSECRISDTVTECAIVEDDFYCGLCGANAAVADACNDILEACDDRPR